MSCTIKLILPCQACIDTAHIAGAMDIAESDARTLGLYGAEIKGITVNIYRGTALIGVEQLAIQINSIVTAQLLQLADTNMSTPILGTVVIAYIIASPYIAAAVIASYLTITHRTLIVETVIVGLTSHHANAIILSSTGAGSAIIQIRIIVATAILKHRAKEQLATAILYFLGKTNIEVGTLYIYMGAGLLTHAAIICSCIRNHGTAGITRILGILYSLRCIGETSISQQISTACHHSQSSHLSLYIRLRIFTHTSHCTHVGNFISRYAQCIIFLKQRRSIYHMCSCMSTNIYFININSSTVFHN